MGFMVGDTEIRAIIGPPGLMPDQSAAIDALRAAIQPVLGHWALGVELGNLMSVQCTAGKAHPLDAFRPGTASVTCFAGRQRGLAPETRWSAWDNRVSGWTSTERRAHPDGAYTTAPYPAFVPTLTIVARLGHPSRPNERQWFPLWHGLLRKMTHNQDNSDLITFRAIEFSSFVSHANLVAGVVTLDSSYPRAQQEDRVVQYLNAAGYPTHRTGGGLDRDAFSSPEADQFCPQATMALNLWTRREVPDDPSWLVPDAPRGQNVLKAIEGIAHTAGFEPFLGPGEVHTWHGAGSASFGSDGAIRLDPQLARSNEGGSTETAGVEFEGVSADVWLLWGGLFTVVQATAPTRTRPTVDMLLADDADNDLDDGMLRIGCKMSVADIDNEKTKNIVDWKRLPVNDEDEVPANEGVHRLSEGIFWGGKTGFNWDRRSNIPRTAAQIRAAAAAYLLSYSRPIATYQATQAVSLASDTRERGPGWRTRAAAVLAAAGTTIKATPYWTTAGTPGDVLVEGASHDINPQRWIASKQLAVRPPRLNRPGVRGVATLLRPRAWGGVVPPATGTPPPDEGPEFYITPIADDPGQPAAALERIGIDRAGQRNDPRTGVAVYRTGPQALRCVWDLPADMGALPCIGWRVEARTRTPSPVTAFAESDDPFDTSLEITGFAGALDALTVTLSMRTVSGDRRWSPGAGGDADLAAWSQPGPPEVEMVRRPLSGGAADGRTRANMVFTRPDDLADGFITGWTVDTNIGSAQPVQAGPDSNVHTATVTAAEADNIEVTMRTTLGDSETITVPLAASAAAAGTGNTPGTPTAPTQTRASDGGAVFVWGDCWRASEVTGGQLEYTAQGGAAVTHALTQAQFRAGMWHATAAAVKNTPVRWRMRVRNAAGWGPWTAAAELPHPRSASEVRDLRVVRHKIAAFTPADGWRAIWRPPADQGDIPLAVDWSSGTPATRQAVYDVEGGRAPTGARAGPLDPTLFVTVRVTDSTGPVVTVRLDGGGRTGAEATATTAPIGTPSDLQNAVAIRDGTTTRVGLYFEQPFCAGQGQITSLRYRRKGASAWTTLLLRRTGVSGRPIPGPPDPAGVPGTAPSLNIPSSSRVGAIEVQTVTHGALWGATQEISVPARPPAGAIRPVNSIRHAWGDWFQPTQTRRALRGQTFPPFERTTLAGTLFYESRMSLTAGESVTLALGFEVPGSHAAIVVVYGVPFGEPEAPIWPGGTYGPVVAATRLGRNGGVIPLPGFIQGVPYRGGIKIVLQVAPVAGSGTISSLSGRTQYEVRNTARPTIFAIDPPRGPNA